MGPTREDYFLKRSFRTHNSSCPEIIIENETERFSRQIFFFSSLSLVTRPRERNPKKNPSRKPQRFPEPPTRAVFVLSAHNIPSPPPKTAYPFYSCPVMPAFGYCTRAEQLYERPHTHFTGPVATCNRFQNRLWFWIRGKPANLRGWQFRKFHR